MKRQIIFNKLFEFGGSNSHLEALILYFGGKNIVLILDEESQLQYLAKIKGGNELKTIINPGLHKFAHLIYPSVFSNIKEFFKILRSLWQVASLAIKHRTNEITLCTVDPEKYLYMLWIPFCKLTYIMHSTPPERYTSFTSFTCNFLLGKQKRIVTVSNANQREIIKNWQISETKQKFVNVIYNCVDKTPIQHRLCAEVSPTKDIITMGHFVSYKNPAAWLKTATTITRQFADVRFIWLGDGELLNEFKIKTEREENILLPGVTDDPNSYLENATIYYQPSLEETHGIAVLEAMSWGLPCVVSDAGGLPESVVDGVNGILVPPEDVNKHVAALEKLITDPQLCSDYGSNGFKKYQELFTFEKFRSEMDKIYMHGTR